MTKEGDTMQDNRQVSQQALQRVQIVANKVFPGMAMFARDVNLPQGLSEKYTRGVIV